MIATLIISALFVILFTGIEVAYSSYSKLHLNLDSQNDSYYFSKKYFLPTILIANILALIVYTISFSATLNLSLGEDWMMQIVEIIIIGLSIILVSNLIARIAFSSHPLQKLKLIQYIYYPVYIILLPFTVIYTVLTKFIFKCFGLNNSKDIKAFDKTDLLHLSKEIFDKNENGSSSKDINTFFQRALEFSELLLKDCMLPFTDVISVEKNIDPNNLKKIFIESGYSRILVYDDEKENVVGYVSSRDFIKSNTDIYTMLRAIESVPETIPAQNQLNTFIKKKQTIALVIDEFGNNIGLVSIEDLIEEIFGSIDDEYDTSNQSIKRLGNSEYILQGKTEVDDLNEIYNLRIPKSDEYKTIAGYVTYKMEKFPSVGEKLKTDNLLITVLEVSTTRVELLRLKKLDEQTNKNT